MAVIEKDTAIRGGNMINEIHIHPWNKKNLLSVKMQFTWYC